MAYVVSPPGPANPARRTSSATPSRSSRRRPAPRRATSSTRPTRTPPSPSVFRLFEIYADEEAYAAHGASDHFKTFALEQAIPVLAKRERAFYETLA